MARAPSKSALAKRMEAERPVAVVADQPAFQARDGIDSLDLHLGIVSHLDPGSMLGAALIETMDAAKLSGNARLTKLDRSIRMLLIEARKIDPQFVVTAVAMAFALPAWIGVVLHCARIV